MTTPHDDWSASDSGSRLPSPVTPHEVGGAPAHGQPAYGYPAYGQPAYGQPVPAYGGPAAPYGAGPQGYGGPVDQSALFRAQAEYEEQRKSTGLAYVFWVLLGAFGAHRFYLRRTGTAVAQLVLSLTFFGLVITGIWLVVDLFLIPGIVTQVNANAKRDAFARYRVPLY